MHRVAIQNASPDVTAAAALSKDGNHLFQQGFAELVAGGYGCLGPGTAEEQQ